MYLQKLIEQKNQIITNLIKKVKKSKQNVKSKYLGVVRCENVIRTITGSEKFVRRRLAELCTLHKAELIFCCSRLDCEKDRSRLADVLRKIYGKSVIIYEGNRRFEFLKLTDALTIQCSISNILQRHEY